MPAKNSPVPPVRARRRRLGVSLDELGTAMGVDSGTLSRFERGYRALPRGLTRADYERVLDQLEAERTAVGA
jgi:transcriptional regulator with XRE-family HTH domain